MLTSTLFNRKMFKPDHHIYSLTQIQTDPIIKESLKNVKIFLFDKDDTLVPLH